MKRTTITFLMLLLLVQSASAIGPGGRTYPKMYENYNRAARWFNANVTWHAPYANTTWQQPVAMIVPPVANMQTTYSWGVGRTRMVPTYHQFTRPYVAPGGGGGELYAAPNWPSSTLQQGVYSVRGPW